MKVTALSTANIIDDLDINAPYKVYEYLCKYCGMRDVYISNIDDEINSYLTHRKLDLWNFPIYIENIDRLLELLDSLSNSQDPDYSFINQDSNIRRKKILCYKALLQKKLKVDDEEAELSVSDVISLFNSIINRNRKLYDYLCLDTNSLADYDFELKETHFIKKCILSRLFRKNFSRFASRHNFNSLFRLVSVLTTKGKGYDFAISNLDKVYNTLRELDSFLVYSEDFEKPVAELYDNYDFNDANFRASIFG